MTPTWASILRKLLRVMWEVASDIQWAWDASYEDAHGYPRGDE